MARRVDVYSRVVAWLKILLPLTALAILSTLFLLSRTIDPTTTIPFTTIDLAERARDQQITEPQFSGASADGDLLSFHAKTARPDPATPGRTLAQTLNVRIDTAAGAIITFTAHDGVVNEGTDRATLSGDVVITSSLGYRVVTDKLISGMQELYAQSPGPVSGNGPPGQFTAGTMLLSTDPVTKDTHMLFKDGVKLIYDPTGHED